MPTQDKGEHPDEHEFLVNFFPVEGDRTIACMGSWGIEMPRTTDDFVASAERVRTPLFAAAMAECEPTSEVHLTRSTGNKWRRYDRLPTVPSGVVFIGDAICAFNPFYAQGISSAAGSALILREHLQAATDAGPAVLPAVPRRAAQGAQGAVGDGDGARPRLRVRHRHRDPACRGGAGSSRR